MKVFASSFLSCVVLLSAPSSVYAAPPQVEGDAGSSLSSRAVFIDIAAAGHRLVAVGERGIVLVSDDNAKSWRRAKTPVESGLTAVRFVSPTEGWAVGHAGVILHTENGGDDWVQQLDGRRVAQLELTDSKAALDRAEPQSQEEGQHRYEMAQRLVDDGPDKPFLAMEFSDSKHGVVVGAFGLAVRTSDGGKTWSSAMGDIQNPNGMHLYAIAHDGQRWYLAGEQGFFARSDDGGAKFVAQETPYAGTYFTLSAQRDGKLYLAGLKGNAFVSTDHGDSFVPLVNHVPATINSSLLLADGRVLMASQAGQVFVTTPSQTLEPFGSSLYAPLSGLAQTEDGNVVAAGFAGLRTVPPIQ